MKGDNTKIEGCGDNFKFNNNVISLPVSIKGLPKQIEVEGYTLSLRSAFHISLVCIGKIKEKYNISISDFEEKVIDDFCNFHKEKNIILKNYRNEFRFVNEGERKTVVVMCGVSNLDSFFDFLNKKYNLKLEYPPTHVTLYTLQPDAGIFLVDSSDISKLSKVIEVPRNIKTPFNFN